MKKNLFYISILTLVLAIGAMGNAFAQSDTATISISINPAEGCHWSGAEWSSNLTVPDNEVCVIQGTGRTAIDVTVEADLDGSGQEGGKLIVGSDNTDTDFTLSGTMYAYGAVEIGNALGNVAYDSELILSSHDLNIGDTNSAHSASLKVLSNSLGDNNLNISSHTIFVGNSSNPNAILEYNDGGSATNTANYIIGYGTLNNLAGQLTIGNNLSFYNNGTVDNQAPITAQRLYLGYYTGSLEGGTFTNNTNGTLTITYSTELYRGDLINNNTGTSISVNINGNLYIRGVSGDMSTITNKGVFKHTGTFHAYEYGLLDLKTGTNSRYVNTSTSYFSSDVGGATPGKLNIESGAVYSGSNTRAYSADIQNAGTIDMVNTDGTTNSGQYCYFYLYNDTTFNNTGTADLYTIELHNSSTVTNSGTMGIGTDVQIKMYNTSIFTNSGTIDSQGAISGYGYIITYDTSTFTNSTTGSISVYEIDVYGSSGSDSIFNNYGIIAGAEFHSLYVGKGSTEGGLFRNYAHTSGINISGGRCYVYEGGIFRNKANARVSFTEMYIKNSTSSYIQEVGDASNNNIKTYVSGNINLGDIGGTFESGDLTSINGTLYIHTGGTYHQKNTVNDETTNVTAVHSTSTAGTIHIDAYTAPSFLIIDENTTANCSGITGVYGTSNGSDPAVKGHLTNNGTLITNLLYVESAQVSGGLFESSTNSHLTINDHLGMRDYYNAGTASVEIAGTLSGTPELGHSWGGNALEGGKLCVGQWVSNTCQTSGHNLVLGGIEMNKSTMEAYIANNIEVQGDVLVINGSLVLRDATASTPIHPYMHLTTDDTNVDLTNGGSLYLDGELTMQGSSETAQGRLLIKDNATAEFDYGTSNIGRLNIQRGGTAGNIASLFLNSGVTLNLNGF